MSDPFGSFGDMDPTGYARKLAAMNQDPSAMSIAPDPMTPQFMGPDPNQQPDPNDTPPPVTGAPPPPVGAKPPSSGGGMPTIPGMPNPSDDEMGNAKAEQAKARETLMAMQGPMQANLKAAQDANTDYAHTLHDRAATIESTVGNTPKDRMKLVMQQSPLFLGLAALAGGQFHTGATTGLAAMNGAVKGIIEGDQLAYQDAITKYKAALQEMQMKFDLQDKEYTAAQKNFGLSAEGNQLALQFANAKLGWDTDELNKFEGQRAMVGKLLWEAKQNQLRFAEMEKIATIRAGAQGGMGDMSPEQLHNAAIAVTANPMLMRQYASYGGRGQAIRTAVGNEQARLMKEAGVTESDVLRQQAIVAAQVHSVKDLVGMQNAVRAYETVATGNGQRVLELVNTVNSSGVPMINSAERLGKLALGDPNAAELMQVLQNYQSEVARIIANPTLKGPLTDTARQEMHDVIPANLTPAQAKRLVDRLNYEFELRDYGINDALRQGLAGAAGSLGEPANTPAPTPPQAPFGAGMPPLPGSGGGGSAGNNSGNNSIDFSELGD